MATGVPTLLCWERAVLALLVPERRLSFYSMSYARRLSERTRHNEKTCRPEGKSPSVLQVFFVCFGYAIPSPELIVQ